MKNLTKGSGIIVHMFENTFKFIEHKTTAKLKKIEMGSFKKNSILKINPINLFEL